MRKALIIISVLLLIAIVVIGGIVGTLIPFRSETQPGGLPTSPLPVPVPAPQPTPTPAPSPSPTPTPSPVPVPPKPADVKFDLAITSITGTGLSRNVTATVTNTGTADAHNVSGKIEAFSQGSRVALNGQDFLTVNIGTIQAGKTATTQVTLSFSLADGLRISQTGVNLALTITSTEATGTFNYDYKP